MLLSDIDLNLLVLFRRLAATRSVSRTAQDLGLSQPAASNALARLRRHFDDPLFIRTPAGMEPTPRAMQLAEPIRQALETLETAFSQRAEFVPRRSDRSFTMGMTDIGEIYFLPMLMDRLRDAAPAVSISTVRNTSVQLKEGLEQGQVDLAIGLLPQLQAGFHQRRLFTQRYVCLFRHGHALDGRRLTLRGFEAAEHVVVVSAGTGHGQVDELLARSGVQRHVRLTVPHFVAVGHILQHSDMVATVPEKLAQALAEPFGLSHAPHPARLPAFDVGVFWHAKVHKDPANQWLRQLIVETFAP
jgi:DNA-binding transcriptional LysR family regulator